MALTVLLLLDLGDALTKAVAVEHGSERRLRFPSVVARRLLKQADDREQLLLSGDTSFLRPVGFEDATYPRVRSYPEAETVLKRAAATPEGPTARYAGWPAVTYGADRQLLGYHPTVENVDALVHKALLLLRPDQSCEADVLFLLDTGRKAEAIQSYVAGLPRTTASELRSFRQPKPRRVSLTVHGRVVDAAECARAAFAADQGLTAVARWLLVDIGYLRTRLTILSPMGCEDQRELCGLGVSDCLLRVLRDGQEQGLFEDEFAAMRALEKSPGGVVEVAGRSYDMQSTLQSARRSLVEELARAAERALVEQYQRTAEMCRGVAVIGGGAALLGAQLGARVQASNLGVERWWVSEDTSYFLLTGARSLATGLESIRTPAR